MANAATKPFAFLLNKIKVGIFGSIQLYYLIMFLGLISLILSRMTIAMADPDLWGYLSFGRLFSTTQKFPYQDVFAYTPTRSIWIYHEWLSGIILYYIDHVFGPAGLQFIKYILGLGAAFLIFLTARLRGASITACAISLLLISPMFSFSYSPVRAQIFTILFFSATLFILEYFRISGKKSLLFLLPFIMIFWANLHGGFVAGLGMIALYIILSTYGKRKYVFPCFILALSTAVTLINPYGLKYWIYLMDAIAMARPDIGEWQSVLWALNSGEYLSNALYSFFLFAFTMMIIIYSKKIKIIDILLIAITSYLAFRHIRHQSFLFVIAGCILPGYFMTAWEKITRRSPEKAARWSKLSEILWPVIFLVFFIFFGFRFFTAQPLSLQVFSNAEDHSITNHYPDSAVEYIRQSSLQGNMLTEFDWGEYIIWRLPDKCRIAMDGRYETVYPQNLCTEYFDFYYGKAGWQKFLDAYPHELILLRPESVATALIRSRSEWRQEYIDSNSVLFVRNNKLNIIR